jgi:hypothetical protein
VAAPLPFAKRTPPQPRTNLFSYTQTKQAGGTQGGEKEAERQQQAEQREMKGEEMQPGPPPVPSFPPPPPAPSSSSLPSSPLLYPPPSTALLSPSGGMSGSFKRPPQLEVKERPEARLAPSSTGREKRRMSHGEVRDSDSSR